MLIVPQRLRRYGADVLNALRRDRFQVKPDGDIVLFGGGMTITGEYIEGVNGRDWRRHKNLIVDQGIRYILNAGLGPGTTTRITAWYLAPFSGSSSPASSWTAANFTSNSTEITATSPEGFSETTRQAATLPDTSANDYIDNYASKATFTAVTASTLSVTGLGLLSNSTRGSTAGTLFSAVKFATARSLQNGDAWQAGYRATLAGT